MFSILAIRPYNRQSVACQNWALEWLYSFRAIFCCYWKNVQNRDLLNEALVLITNHYDKLLLHVKKRFMI